MRIVQFANRSLPELVDLPFCMISLISKSAVRVATPVSISRLKSCSLAFKPVPVLVCSGFFANSSCNAFIVLPLSVVCCVWRFCHTNIMPRFLMFRNPLRCNDLRRFFAICRGDLLPNVS